MQFTIKACKQLYASKRNDSLTEELIKTCLIKQHFIPLKQTEPLNLKKKNMTVKSMGVQVRSRKTCVRHAFDVSLKASLNEFSTA